MHIDHYPKSLDSLINEFLAVNNYKIEDMKTRNDGGGKIAMLDKEIANKWMNFHKLNAKFVFSCSTCNQSRK